jgi:predicted MFS family arabinose efflux permease
MRLFSRLFRLIWGGDVDRALRPVLAVSLAGSIAGSSAYTYLGIWAIRELGAPQSKLAFAYLGGAFMSLVVGYIGGHWSDKVGRRPMILLGWGAQALVPAALLAVGDHVNLGLLLIAFLPAFGSLGGAADQAMVADLVAPERHEAAYAAVRVAANLGVTIGPPIGGLLLIGNHWSHLWAGTLVLALGGFAIAWRYIPRSGAYAPKEPPTRGSFAVIVRDKPFLLFMLASVAIMILNPISVTLFQLRLTRWTSSIPPSVKLGVAMPLMGVPFLLLNVNGSALVIAFVIVLFVIGEMLWVPTSQAVVAALAPADIRGAYMGAFSASWSVGWALTPFLGLQIRNAYGDATMWMCVAAVGVVAGILGLVAARGHDAEAAVVGSPA